MSLSIESQIESILFFKGEPVTIKDLSKFLEVSEETVKTGVQNLQSHLSSENRGLQVVTNGDEVTLSTHPEMHTFFDELTKAELTKDLSKAALETLSIIIYRGPLTRSQIDYIRGVNSQFIIRTLLIRGLVTRVDNPKDERSFLYKPSLELLQLLGVSKQEDMPDYEQVKSDVETFVNTKEEEEKEESEIQNEAE